MMPTIRLPYPHQGQQAVRRQAARFNWLAAGRRWRKTTLAMSIAVEAAIAGKVVLWGAPTYDQVRIGFNETKYGVGDTVDDNISRMEISFPTGGQILYRSLDDPDNARGFTAGGVVIDEVGDVKQEAWYEVMRPMLIDTDGWLWAIGTPKGRNWFFREHTTAHDRPDSMTWQIPTVGCEIVDGRLVRMPHPMENPDIPFAEIEHLYETLPERVFRQEVLAEFIEGEGAVFRNIRACLTAPVDAMPAVHQDHRVVCGVDWAKHQDFSCFSVGCADCRQELALDRFNQVDYVVQRGRLAALAEKWYVKHIECELNSIGEPNFEQLQRDGLPVHGFQTTASSKPPLIESLVLCFEREEMAFLDDDVARAELEAYERTVNAHTGRSRYNAPDGMHDDTVMARALMWRAIHTAPGPVEMTDNPFFY